MAEVEWTLTSERALPREDWRPLDENPSYLRIVECIYSTFTNEWRNRRSENLWIVDFVHAFRHFSAITLDDLLATLVVAVVITMLRSALTQWVFKVSNEKDRGVS